MSEHTIEPWPDADAAGPACRLSRADYDHARRCVNALAGLNPEAVPDFLLLAHRVNDLRRENCALKNENREANRIVTDLARAGIKGGDLEEIEAELHGIISEAINWVTSFRDARERGAT